MNLHKKTTNSVLKNNFYIRIEGCSLHHTNKLYALTIIVDHMSLHPDLTKTKHNKSYISFFFFFLLLLVYQDKYVFIQNINEWEQR